MNEREFCYWLKGFFELTDTNDVDAVQVAMIKEHLDLVFTKVTKSKPELLQETIDQHRGQIFGDSSSINFIDMPEGWTPGWTDPETGMTYCCEDRHTPTINPDGTPAYGLYSNGPTQGIINVPTVTTC